ncbi:hypothetical protein QQF64_005059 [Cirrhinus molitorella]|uniref:Uncharacterized protein n=1 Tax=Cirrhinus molitorella TaxID=172907 RepID=A0ABR3MKC4_9TELE
MNRKGKIVERCVNGNSLMGMFDIQLANIRYLLLFVSDVTVCTVDVQPEAQGDIIESNQKEQQLTIRTPPTIYTHTRPLLT